MQDHKESCIPWKVAGGYWDLKPGTLVPKLTILTFYYQRLHVNLLNLQERFKIRIPSLDARLQPCPIDCRDGTPVHFRAVASDFSTVTQGDRWINRGGPHLWPAWSADFSLLKFSVLGHLQSLVYPTPVENVEDLWNLIIAGCNIIRNNPRVFENPLGQDCGRAWIVHFEKF